MSRARLLKLLAGIAMALAGGLGVAVAIAAVPSVTIAGQNLVCKVGTRTVPCSSNTNPTF